MREKLIVSGLVRIYPSYIQSVGSLPYSQDPGSCSCPQRDQSTPRLLFGFFKIHLFSFHRRLWLPSGLHSSGIPTKTCTPLFSPYMQRTYVRRESTDVRHFKSLCCVYSYDPHLKHLVDFHEISY